ncbi:MAG: class I SAM-dependent methyltransferase [Nannocystaceae bacterium]|nr:class I SAM-dependent methyltransferase [Nannocystaceae bacterium]
MADDYGNKQKHESSNPIQQALLDRFKREAVRLSRRVAPATVLEVGCGEGYMLEVLHDADLGAALTGVDFSKPAIADARKRLGDKAKLEPRDARELADDGRTFDMVMMLEVLEHIPDPAQMLPILEQLTSRYLLLSVPWEPFFRGLNLVRGKHVSAWGNDPEHVNHWGRRSFLAFVQRRFTILETPIVFPWTMVLAEKRTDTAGG